MALFWQNFWPNYFGTVIGGLSLTILYFIFRDKLFSLPDLNGEWKVETTCLKTDYNPFQGMKVYFVATLLQDGRTITGTGEKTNESAIQGDRKYEGKSRVQIEIRGTVRKDVFRGDHIQLHIFEHGELRPTTAYHELRVSNQIPVSMNGTYRTTAANSKGSVTWTLHE